MIKTFRGLITTGTQDTVVLHTNTGETGYRIKKFQVMPSDPTSATLEAVVQIWKVSTTPTDVVDFSDQTLLGVIFYNQDSTAANHITETIIFDSEIFNQDIYITSVTGNSKMNYYLELEQVKLDLNESTVATLKDIRNAARVPLG